MPKKIQTGLVEMTKKIQDLKMEFNQDIETLKRTQDEMNMELKNPIVQLQKSKESFTSRINQVEDRISCLEDKIENLDQTSKKHEKLSTCVYVCTHTKRKETHRKWKTPWKEQTFTL